MSNKEQLVRESLDRVTVTTGFIDLRLRTVAGEFEDRRIAWTAPRNRQRRSVIEPQGERTAWAISATSRARLLISIVKARIWLQKLIDGDVQSSKDIALHEKCSERSFRMTLSLAFLPPDIIKSAIDGSPANTAGLVKLMDPPIIWTRNA